MMLDRSLTFKKHYENTQANVNTRNNIQRKLVNSKWGADANTLKISAMALSSSVAEYACPVWKSSAHAKNLDITLKKMQNYNRITQPNRGT